MKKRLKLLVMALPVVAVMLGAILAAAPANAVAKPTPGDAQGHSPAYVIVDPGSAVKGANGSTFYPTGKVGSDTLVVIANADGTLPGGVTPATLARLGSRMSGTAAVTPMIATPLTYTAAYGIWTGPLNGISIIGSTGLKVTYQFNSCGSCNQTNQGLGKGYYQGYNGSTFGVWAAWYNLGSAWSQPQPHNGGGTVPWGNVLAVTQFKAKCGTTAVCAGNWGP